MRLFALVSILAALSPPSCCERRNETVCSTDPGFECAEGYTCSIPQGEAAGMCIQIQCTADKNTCPDTMPICTNGQCGPCGDDDECKGTGKSLPVCDTSGRCVECLANKDCTADPSKSVCDTANQVCRACQLHSECASSVCAKDDAFATLNVPIPQGSCVDAGRVNLVTTGNQTTINNLITNGLVNQTHPYVRITNLSGTNGPVNASMLPDGLPTLYFIGPKADTPPSKLGNSPPALTYSTGPALDISSGVNTIVEGMAFSNSNIGVRCTGGGLATKVKIVRSLFTANGTAITTTGTGCDLTIDSTWIGKALSLSGNTLAMDLSSTSLSIVNSVFLRNGNPGGSPTPSVIKIAGSPLVRIVNSTFVDLNVPSTNKALAIDCSGLTAGYTTIVNSLFLNSTPPGPPNNLNTYVFSNCRPNTSSVVGVGSNEAGLTGTSTVTDPSLDWTVLVDPMTAGDVHYSATAPVSLTAGGVDSASDMSGAIAIPSVDMEGKARPAGQNSIGAFQK